MRSLLPALLALAPLAAACADDAAPGTDDTVDAVRTESASALTFVKRVRDRVVDQPGGAALEVTIVADGAGLSRRVGVHASIDGGAWFDVAATRTAARNAATDTWTATVAPAGGFTSIQYVVWAEPTTGARQWDNHGGANYRTDARRAVAWAGERRDGAALVVSLDVENRSYDKQCTAVYTTDDWARTQYVPGGTYVGSTGRAGIERWELRIEPPTTGVTLDRAAALEYAVSCTFAGGDARWDDNGGENFRYERATPPVQAWTTPFSAALDVELAPDGTVFALSTSDPPSGASPGSRRWMTIYAPDGTRRGVVTFPVDAERLTFVAAADLVIADLWAPDPQQVRRYAVRRDGTVAWDQTGPRGWITVAGDSAFLVAGDKVARLGGAAPAGVACASPTIAPSGVAACVDGTATRVVDVDTGARVASLPAGEPFAISDDGAVVVLATGADQSGGYTTALTAYRADGSVAWRKTGLTAPPDHAWGAGRVLGDCTDHAIGDVIGLVDQPPTGAAVVLLDVRTGAERRRIPVSSAVVQACPDEDGRFHWNDTYMRYGRWTDSVDPASATAAVERLDVGFYGAIGGLAPGGRAALVAKPYIGWTGGAPQPRLVVADPAGERYSDVRDASAAPLADVAGTRAVVFDGAALVRLDL